MDFNSVKHVHFVGIGGSGMSVLAEAMLNDGYTISGSDMKESQRLVTLRDKGIAVSVPHSVELMGSADLLCYSSAIPKNNCERVLANQRGIEEICRGELLARFLRTKEIFAVAGSHGKTTTSAYLANVLNRLGAKSGLFIGGLLQGEEELDWDHERFVVETDESDGTFLNFKPKYGIITNIDKEHLAFYGSFENLVAAFEKFFYSVDSFPIICGDDKLLSQIACDSSRSYMSYGLQAHNDIWANHIDHEVDGTSFDVLFKSSFVGRLKIPLKGEHNILNSLAVLALATLLGYDFPQIKKAMRNFGGVKRRMETKAQCGETTFVDDYAHHPTEIKATLAAAKNYCRVSGKRLVAVFEPHRHSRVRDCYGDFLTCFDDADLLVVTDIYGAAEEGVENIRVEKLFSDIKLATDDVDVIYCPVAELAQKVSSLLEDGDYLLGMGAGRITSIVEDIASKYKEKNV